MFLLADIQYADLQRVYTKNKYRFTYLLILIFHLIILLTRKWHTHEDGI